MSQIEILHAVLTVTTVSFKLNISIFELGTQQFFYNNFNLWQQARQFPECTELYIQYFIILSLYSSRYIQKVIISLKSNHFFAFNSSFSHLITKISQALQCYYILYSSSASVRLFDVLSSSTWSFQRTVYRVPTLNDS